MHSVKIYTTPACVYCKMAKEFFQENKINYTEHNVVEDLTARKEMIDRSGQMGVPVVDIDGNIVVGFNKPKFMELLGIK